LKTDDTVIASKTLPASGPFAAASIIITQNSATDVPTAGNGESITATITGVLGPNVPVVRTLQHKLDDNVSTLDFGATDSTDCTAKFQKAIDEIYLRSFDKSLPKSRIPVRIPAGVYYTTATIYLPPFVTLIGDGIDKTIIRSISAGNTTIFATIDGDSTPTNRITGTNILSTNQPRQIRISGMTLEQTGTILTTQTTPIVQLDYARDTILSEVKFKGNYQAGNTVTNSNSAIELGFNTSDLTIERCQFEQLSYPIVSNWNVEDIAIIENTFQDLYMGITLAQSLLPEVSSRNIGPNRVSIRDNKFIDISRQAIFAGVNTSTNNQINSENNTFINVGNNLNGDAEPASPIITFGSHGNSSTNDNFERLWFMQTGELDTPQFEVIEGTALVRLKFTDRQLIEESTVTQTLIRIPYASTITSVSMDYTIEKTGIARKGTLSVVASDAGISFKDSYAVAGSSDGDTVFSADFLDHGPVDINDTLAVQYTNPVAAGTGTIIFNVSYYR
jgi:hypothetical protein